MTIFITGAAGYIGGMLADHLLEREDVDELICLDRSPMPSRFTRHPRVLWICCNTVDDEWKDLVAARKPDSVIHCAWQIREFYFRKKTQRHWNIDGSRNVFEFALQRHSEMQSSNPGVSKIYGIPRDARDDGHCHLIYLSSVAVYGAYPDNRADRPFTEADPMRESEYRYGMEKRQSEEELAALYNKHVILSIARNPEDSTSNRIPRDTRNDGVRVTVLRLASVTGPRYKSVKKGFTLQNILALLPIIPIANPEWGRQFVQEQDIIKIVSAVCHSRKNEGNTLDSKNDSYRVFNVSPAVFLNAAEIAAAYGKKIVVIPKELVRIVFFVLRHLSFGRLSTSRGGWRFFTYPLVVDGSSINQDNVFAYNTSNFLPNTKREPMNEVKMSSAIANTARWLSRSGKLLRILGKMSEFLLAHKIKPSIIRIIKTLACLLIREITLTYNNTLKISGSWRHRWVLWDIERGQYEPLTTELFKRVLKTGAVVFDIGGHIGYYSLIAAHAVGREGKVYVFEPDVRNFKSLCKNILRNGFSDSILPFQKAISDFSGRRKFYLDKENTSLNSLIKYRDNIKEKNIEIVSLDDFIKKNPINIDIIKMDIEGGELNALQGMANVIAENQSLVLFIECNLEALGSLQAAKALIEKLIEYNFCVTLIDDIESKFYSVDEVSSDELLHKTYNLFCQKK